ncbi:hypothetical protein [Mucilaginibacter sp.]|uniref:hypothetical protein n=1 Tax=Mucilaginibacter sp. TaxID=1882438 RepID=UPI0028454143|nr:hypothetical protein [Mucilaginibacter sp.]MDR3695774.1 hypothetical protein [Mucilaginibacter sp.]
MRKITKVCSYSTKYYTWLQGLGASDHVEYTAAFRFYWDVVMNLFYCQEGLCAYTEKKLCPKHFYSADKWDNGKYQRRNYYPKKPKVKGELEHFDTKLKPKQGWLWTNLFMVDSDINSKGKGMLEIDPILKPDAPNYDEFLLFDYDLDKNIFLAKSVLPIADKNKINPVLDNIINFDSVIEERRLFFAPLLKLVEFGKSWNNITVEQFPTSFELVKRQKNKPIV